MEDKKKVKSGKDRQTKGFGGLRKLDNGNYEGTLDVHKENGDIISKSFTRSTKAEVNNIKYQLKAKEPVPNDVLDIKIDKRTNEITLVREKDLIESKTLLSRDILVDDYVEYWLWNHRQRGVKRKKIKGTTLRDYIDKSNFIKAKLGTVEKGDKSYKIKVRDLTFHFIETKLLELYDEVSENTAIQVRNHIYNMMKFAKKDGIINENPLQDETINFPVSNKKFKRKIIEEKDVEKVIECCLKYNYIDVLTQLLTGGRVSEIRGLVWKNVNIDKCEIEFANNYITTQQYDLDEQGHIKAQGTKSSYTTLKSSASCRVVKIDEAFKPILELHRKLQEKRAEKSNMKFKENDPVFTGRWYGKPLGKTTTNDRIKKIMEELKIENWNEITSHCLRKSFCCAGIFNGVPMEYMSRLLGHNSIKVTETYYSEYKQEKINEYAEQTNKNRVVAFNNISKQVANVQVLSGV